MASRANSTDSANSSVDDESVDDDDDDDEGDEEDAFEDDADDVDRFRTSPPSPSLTTCLMHRPLIR